MPHISPSKLDADHINAVVIFQVFTRESATEIDPTSLRKYVGILEGYIITPGRTDVKLVGLPIIETTPDAHYIELYLISR